MKRLFRSRFSPERYEAHEGQASNGWIDRQVAPKGQLWWSEKQPDQGALWGSWIELGEDFYRAITTAPVPVDLRALRVRCQPRRCALRSRSKRRTTPDAAV